MVRWRKEERNEGLGGLAVEEGTSRSKKYLSSGRLLVEGGSSNSDGRQHHAQANGEVD